MFLDAGTSYAQRGEYVQMQYTRTSEVTFLSFIQLT